ncbi:aldehyde ferredoxin oxidoreductase family protein [Chloroflexota bacterium]
MLDQPLGGYNGKILRVNLSNSSILVEEIDERFCQQNLGGAGFVSYILWKELIPGIDPLGPENKLVLALGPLTGIPIPGSGRHCVGSKSPLTGGFAKSEAGGHWGAELKHAGYDAIIIEGKASKPVYLWIKDGEATLSDASDLWGMNTKETQQAIRVERQDDLIRVAAIGPAGENTVRFACIINDLHEAAGRGGMGAVMGSKKLKAIAIRGHQKPRVVFPERLKELRQWLLHHRELWAGFHDIGTGDAMVAGEKTGNLPVRNFRDGEFPDVSKISGQAVKDTIRIKMESCHACSVRCKKVVSVTEPFVVDPAYGGPEYETLAALGSNCCISDLKAIARGNELCNAYGLDTISTGGVIAFGMECFENGLLKPEDIGGINLRFGSAEDMLQIVELIARREGIGDLLAEGTTRASQKIGGAAPEFSMHVKGMEIPMHEPRLKAALGLGYMVNPHGADHCANIHDTMFSAKGTNMAHVSRGSERFASLGITGALPADELGPRKVEMFLKMQLYRIACDCLPLCNFVPWSPKQAADMLTAVTGCETNIAEILKIARRALTLARLFNVREGFTPTDDKLPDRFFHPKSNGPLSKKYYDYQQLERDKSYYYTLMGWDAQTGVPLPNTLIEMGISDGFIDE